MGTSSAVWATSSCGSLSSWEPACSWRSTAWSGTPESTARLPPMEFTTWFYLALGLASVSMENKLHATRNKCQIGMVSKHYQFPTRLQLFHILCLSPFVYLMNNQLQCRLQLLYLLCYSCRKFLEFTFRR